MAATGSVITRHRGSRRNLDKGSGPVPAALIEQLLVDQLLSSSDGQRAGASAARASFLALSRVASTRGHLACAGRVGAQIVMELGQRDRLETLLRRVIRSSSGDEKVAAVLQLAEMMMRDGQHSKAQDLLATYVHEDPYRNDHRFHGWIGLCCFHLSNEAKTRELPAQHPIVGSGSRKSENGIGAKVPSRRDYSTDAREHLLRALELNPREDQYVRCLSQVLIWTGKKSAAKNLLLNFCVLNPNNPEGFRLLCEFLRHIEGGESTPSPELLSAASHLARCDPASCLAWTILKRANSNCGDKELEALRQLRSYYEVNVRPGAVGCAPVST